MEHSQYLKTHLVYIEGQGLEWLEDQQDTLQRSSETVSMSRCKAAELPRHAVLCEKTERDDDKATKAGQPPTGQAGEISRGHAEAYVQIRSSRVL